MDRFIQFKFIKFRRAMFLSSKSVLLAFALLITSSHLVAEDSVRYGEYTLAEWRQVIKATDFQTLGQPQYVDGLIEIISDENAPWASRRQAAETLGRIGSKAKEAVPVLKKLLAHPGDDALSTRLWVLKSLSLFGTVAADVSKDVSELILDSEQPHLIRVNSMETLGRIGKNGNVALPTFLSILQMKSPEAGSQIDELRTAAAEALWILGPTSASALPMLIETARADWSPLRLASIVTIGEIGPRAEIAIPMLVDTLFFDDAGEVKEVAADALGKIGESSHPVLEKLQHDRDEEVRKYVVRAVSIMKNSPETRQLLINALLDDSSLVQISAADNLLTREAHQHQAQVVLLGHLGSSQWRARLRAYQAVYRHLSRSESLRFELQKRVDDEEESEAVRANSQKLLRKYQFDQR